MLDANDLLQTAEVRRAKARKLDDLQQLARRSFGHPVLSIVSLAAASVVCSFAIADSSTNASLAILVLLSLGIGLANQYRLRCVLRGIAALLDEADD